GGGGNGKGDADIAAGRREDRRVDAHDLACKVERRTAGVAAVHGRVDRDEVVIRAGADVAAPRRPGAGRYRTTEAERVADGNHPVADANRLIVCECDIGEVAVFIDLQNGEIRSRVGADQLRVQFGAVVHDDHEGGATLDDVIVGYEIAVFGNEEAG